MSEQGFPLDEESFWAGCVEHLKQAGHAMEVSLLASAELRLEVAEFDNWNGGTYKWSIRVGLTPPAFGEISADERKCAENRIACVTGELLRGYEDNHSLRDVIIECRLGPAPRDWRRAALAWVAGEGVTNQGRVRSDNVAACECDGLRFRSNPEINLYKAFLRLAVPFAPLPVFVRGGAEYRRLEPDFVIVKDGLVTVVEVDGDTYHTETPAKAQERLRVLEMEGVHVERVEAALCTEDGAAAVADALLARIEKVQRSRG